MTLSIWGSGRAGTRFPSIAAFPRWSKMPSLPQRWETASASSCPVCLARADPNFYTSLWAEGCQPPKVSATIKCPGQRVNFRLKHVFIS